MKRIFCLLFLITTLVVPIVQANTIIWNFDTLSPTTIKHSGYLYVYTDPNTKGIGGSSALQLDLPYLGVGVRHGGVGLWLSNYAGFSLNSVSPYNGPIGNTANNLNFSVNSVVYFSVKASDTSSFGVAFTAYDTSGSFFVVPGKIYVSDSTQLQNSISSTAFQQITWNVGAMHVYKPGLSTGRKPALENIEALELFFPCNKLGTSGQGSGPTALHLYIDDIGTIGTAPVELWNRY